MSIAARNSEAILRKECLFPSAILPSSCFCDSCSCNLSSASGILMGIQTKGSDDIQLQVLLQGNKEDAIGCEPILYFGKVWFFLFCYVHLRGALTKVGVARNVDTRLGPDQPFHRKSLVTVVCCDLHPWPEQYIWREDLKPQTVWCPVSILSTIKSP